MYHLAKKHFKTSDPILYAAAQRHNIDDIVRSSDVFSDLVHAIINQQLSGKAADTIFERLKNLVGRRGIVPKTIINLRRVDLRNAGLSGSKAETIRGLAQAVIDETFDLETIHEHPDGKVVELLTSVKGIGPWTAEMILMFSLGRVDIFSKGDLGLRKGMRRLYGLRTMPSDRTMDRLAKAWRPYRTYAAKVLWRVADEGK